MVRIINRKNIQSNNMSVVENQDIGTGPLTVDTSSEILGMMGRSSRRECSTSERYT